MLDRVLDRLITLLDRFSSDLHDIEPLGSAPACDAAPAVWGVGAARASCSSDAASASCVHTPEGPRAPLFLDPVIASGEPTEVRLRRVAGEYWDLVQRMERQRDEWRTMFFEQSREHHRAQVALQELLTRVTRVTRAIVSTINQARVPAGLPELQNLAEIERDVPDWAGPYLARVEGMAAQAEPLIHAASVLGERPST